MGAILLTSKKKDLFENLKFCRRKISYYAPVAFPKVNHQCLFPYREVTTKKMPFLFLLAFLTSVLSRYFNTTTAARAGEILDRKNPDGVRYFFPL